ncbi:hypothetical protein BC831DRAFT_510841 [Entophlyctis helioformis]|nr:hypothetical protein BC831DRAFT_510841 [Entophlyctis helioformis]
MTAVVLTRLATAPVRMLAVRAAAASARMFRIDGPDAVKFLQGMVTNQMTRIERGGEGILAAF